MTAVSSSPLLTLSVALAGLKPEDSPELQYVQAALNIQHTYLVAVVLKPGPDRLRLLPVALRGNLTRWPISLFSSMMKRISSAFVSLRNRAIYIHKVRPLVSQEGPGLTGMIRSLQSPKPNRKWQQTERILGFKGGISADLGESLRGARVPRGRSLAQRRPQRR